MTSKINHPILDYFDKHVHFIYEEKMEWINVKDRLPDIYEFVLVYSKMPGTNESCPLTIARWNGEKWETLCNEEENNACACGDLFWSTQSNEITHWLPLPEPPKD